ncbi:hypothetical protein G4B88_003139 [Cannabis sativa]|uniref:Reverse transcriptase zinc-binding domain-containing protein n=1 Tax=Cannabis sativa TaxID=3483 RepID=A0A7J6DPP4_CANSA|nr:hypothetical protein G4B88_003139 [Cannabis sativa]
MAAKLIHGALSKKEDCLWVKWINSIYLKDQSIWDYAKKDDASWYFKKSLSIRVNLDEAKLQQAARGDKFSAKKCYNSLVGETPFAYANAIWDTLVLPKHRFIFWQIANSHLLTRDYLHHIMVTPNNLCPVCEAEVETHDHIFFNCYYTSQLSTGGWGTFIGLLRLLRCFSIAAMQPRI